MLIVPFFVSYTGIFGNVYAVDVVAVSQVFFFISSLYKTAALVCIIEYCFFMPQLTCLLLTCDHCHLLETKPICDLDNQRSLLERILYMDPLDVPPTALSPFTILSHFSTYIFILHISFL